MPVKMVEGGIYRTRDGEIVGPLKKRIDRDMNRVVGARMRAGPAMGYPWETSRDTYTDSGSVFNETMTHNDLVELIMVGNDFIPFNGGPNPVPGAIVTARMKAGYAASDSEHLQWDRVLAYRVDKPALVKQCTEEQMKDAFGAWSRQSSQGTQYEAPCGGVTSANNILSLAAAEARIRALEAENADLKSKATQAEKQRDDFFDMLRALTKITGQLAAKMDEAKANG